MKEKPNLLNTKMKSLNHDIIINLNSSALLRPLKCCVPNTYIPQNPKIIGLLKYILEERIMYLRFLKGEIVNKY